MDLGHYEVRIEGGREGISSALITYVEEGGQHSLVGSEEFGPFDTNLDVARWLWRLVAVDFSRRTV